MQYFNEEFNDFFKGLAPNNNKEWFHANKKMYERAVKKPFDNFLLDLIANVKREYAPTLDLAPKNAKFRINRDIRFSKDKTPYKMFVSAVIAPQGRKSREAVGLYLQLGVGELSFGGGSYAPSKEGLSAIRNKIAANPHQFEQLLQEQAFTTFYPTGILGDKNKRLPKHLKQAAEKQPLIANKQFYFVANYEDEALISSPNFMDFVLQHYQAAIPMNKFLHTTVS